MKETLTSTRFIILAQIILCATVLCALGKLTAETWLGTVGGIAAGFGTAIVSAKSLANATRGIKGLLVLLLPLALLSGCVCSTPRACLATSQKALALADKPALKLIGDKCYQAALKCGPVGQERCPAWQKCDKARKAYQAGMDGIEGGLATCNRVLFDLEVK